VAVPKDTLWPIAPHTTAKHQILRKYLDAWLPILGTYNDRVVYIDGFAVPGEYAGGEPGSPIIALEAARTHQAKLAPEFVFLFIEKEPDRVAHLNSRIGALQLSRQYQIHVEQGSFAEKLTSEMSRNCGATSGQGCSMPAVWPPGQLRACTLAGFASTTRTACSIATSAHQSGFNALLSYGLNGIVIYRNLNPATNLMVKGWQIVSSHP